LPLVRDFHDECPNDTDKVVPGRCGCGEVDTDSDSDEVPDCDDEYFQDPERLWQANVAVKK
jgi:hypothetical protein